MCIRDRSIIILGFGFGMTRPALASSLSIAQTPDNQGSAAGYLGSVIPIGHMTTPIIAMPIYSLNPIPINGLPTNVAPYISKG